MVTEAGAAGAQDQAVLAGRGERTDMAEIAAEVKRVPGAAGRAWVVIAALGVFVLSTDLYIATLPQVAEALSTSPALAQLTLTLNLAAYALSTLAMGPLADRFGRARVLRAGLAAFALASALCWAAPTIEALLAGRIGQGLAASSGTVLAAVILRELFDDTGAQRWLAIMALATAAGPAAGPVAGALLAEGDGWRAPFAALCILSVTVLMLARGLPETGVPRPDALRPGPIAASCRAVLRNPAYMRWQLVNAFALGALFAFVTAAPFVFIGTYGLEPLGYAATHGGLVVLYIVTTAASARLAGRVAPERLLALGIRVGLVGLAVLCLAATAGGGAMEGIVLGMALNAVSIGLLMANAWPLMLKAVAPAEVGTAASLAGFSQMALGALASLVAAALPTGSPGAMALAITLFAGAAGLVYAAPLLRGRMRRRSRP